MDWLSDMVSDYQASREQQDMVNQQMLYYGQKMSRTKKKDIINYLQYQSNASMIEQLEEFETPNARHICMGTHEIKILPKGVIGVPTTEGVVNVEYFLCPMCRLLLINKSCLYMF